MGVVAGVRDLEQFFVDVHHRALVHFLSVEVVDNGRKANDETPYEDGPVHGLWRHGPGCWEERHDKRECNVDKGDEVQWDGEFAQGESAWGEWLAPDTLEENASYGDKVAGEQRGDEQADDRIESGSGANVDEREANCDGEREDNGVEGNFRA